jgi:oligosaccharyltransferase complex subunit epsilon
VLTLRKQPFNAFLAGFGSTVGQFVLTGRWTVASYEAPIALADHCPFTASLRMQTTEANKTDFPSVSPER